MSEKERKQSKGELVARLAASLSEEQWTAIETLTGKNLETRSKRIKFFNKILTKGRSGSSAKAIARNLQKWAAAKIGEATGMEVDKDADVASREMNQTGPDVRLSAAARREFPFTLECKSGEQWGLPAAIKQAQANLYPETDWMVVLDRPHPQDEKRIRPVVVVDGEVFFRIWGRAAKDIL